MGISFRMCDISGSPSSLLNLKRVNEAYPISDTRSTCLINNDKIWFFGRTYVDLPNFNFGHDVSYVGAKFAHFNLKTNQWDPASIINLSKISTEENLNELIFVFQSQIFLFLFTAFGPLKNANLYRFDEKDLKFVNFSDVQFGTSGKNAAEEQQRKLILADGEDAHGVYFVDDNYIYSLHISENNSSFTVVGQMEFDKRSLVSWHPTVAALLNNTIYFQGGVHGCGFRYDPTQLYEFNLNTKASNKIAISSDCAPTFGFHGAKTHAIGYPTTNSWTHFTGMHPRGMTDMEFNGEIWTLRNLGMNNTSWQKHGEIVEKIKPHSNYCVVFDKTTKTLFLFADNVGVLKADL